MSDSMTATARALYQFWSGFGIPAYVEGYIPDNSEGDGSLVVPPYITYQLTLPEWRSNAVYNARVWYRDTSYPNITAKVAEIKAAIGEGKSIPIDGGMLILYVGDNFAQYEDVPESHDVKMAYLTMQLNVYAN